MKNYLKSDEVIDWQHPAVMAKAHQIAAGHQTPVAITSACFEWVRDEIYHSADYQMNPVTCRASEVLQFKTGYCYAKSHLLAALLRANHIPVGLCYQRLSLNDDGAPYCLHGLNAVYLSEFGWYRVDARGNTPDINAQFDPPSEQLAYTPQLPGEATFSAIVADPLPIVVNALRQQHHWEAMRDHLPDVSPDMAHHWGLIRQSAACGVRSGDT